MISYIQQLELYRWLTFAFSLVMLFKAVSHYRHKHFTARELIAWTIIWGTVLALALVPKLLNYVSLVLGIKDSVNGFFALWLTILTYATLRLFISNEKNKQSINELTRHMACKEFNDQSLNEKAPTRNHRDVQSQHRGNGTAVPQFMHKSKQ